MKTYIAAAIDAEALMAAIPADTDRILLVTDSNVRPLLPAILPPSVKGTLSVIAAGEQNKNLRSAERLWGEWTVAKATRRSLVINIGGGMVTDLGGFAAATFKRGLNCINISTTLLGAVDAAAGGKTALNFGGIKNQIGVFAMPRAVFVPVNALQTLPAEEMLSGYGEMAKTALLCSTGLTRQVYAVDLEDTDALTPLIAECMRHKEVVVATDPYDHSVRRTLNLGHTAGHAFEAMSMLGGTPLPHGIAVAHGTAVALILSHMLLQMDSRHIYDFRDKVLSRMPPMPLRCEQYPQLLELMHADKKNTDATSLHFALLRAPGECRPDCVVSDDDVCAALDIYRDLTQ